MGIEFYGEPWIQLRWDPRNTANFTISIKKTGGFTKEIVDVKISAPYDIDVTR